MQPTSHGPGRRSLLAAAVAGAMLAPAGVARAQAWPERPVRLIVPFPPGGPSDAVGRIVADELSARLGQPVVVENRGGAGGVVGAAAVAGATDRHTLLLASTGHVVQPALQPRLPYDPFGDFEPVALVSATPLVVVVPMASPYASLRDLAAAARARPGRLTYASGGNGTMNQLAAELFNAAAGTDVMNVTYRGEGALLPDLVTGKVDIGSLNLPTALPMLGAGRLKALATTGRTRLEDLPQVPTMAEAGFPGVEAYGWQALLAPRATPPDGMARLAAAMADFLAQTSVRARLAGIGALPAAAMLEPGATPRSFMQEELVRLGEVVRLRGIRSE